MCTLPQKKIIVHAILITNHPQLLSMTTCSIKTHGSVSCGPRSRHATPVSILTGRTKTSFSHLCISVITYLIGTKFATPLPASQGSLHSKFEGNRSSHFRDTSCQSFVFFSWFFFLLLCLFAHLQKLL